jgi:hypothetical protein
VMDFNNLFIITTTDMPRSNCTDYYCTTCSGQYGKVRRALKAVDKSQVSSYLLSLKFPEFANYGYQDNRRLYIQHLLLGAEFFADSEVNAIICHWESCIDRSDGAAFYDFIVYYFLRYVPNDNSVKKYWVGKCLREIGNTQNESLIETLVLVLKKECPAHIIDFALARAEHDTEIQRVLINSCGHSIFKSEAKP